MSRLLYRLGRGAALHPWRTLGLWVLTAVLVFGLASVAGGTPHDNWDVPGAKAQAGIELLRRARARRRQRVGHRRRPRRRGGAAPATLTALGDRLAAMDHVATVSEPRLSADGDTALFTVCYDVPAHRPRPDGPPRTPRARRPADPRRGRPGRARRRPARHRRRPDDGRGELIGIIAALLILVLAFGSVVGAGLPIGTALVGLGVGSAGLTILAGTMDVSTSAPTVATMVGLGVGIDYALLLVTRHVEYLRQGYDVAEAAGRAMATAGRSVVFAATTVLVSLMGLRLAGPPTYSTFGFATASRSSPSWPRR